MKELSIQEISAAGNKAVDDTIKYIQNTGKAVRDTLGENAAIAYIITVADIMEGISAPMREAMKVNRNEFLRKMGEEHDCESCPNSGDCPIENLINNARSKSSV